MVIAPDQQDRRTHPGRNLGQVDAPFAHEQGQHHRAQEAHQQLHHAGDHGDEGIANALQGRAVAKEQVQHRQTQAHHHQVEVGHVVGLRHLDGIAVGDEQAQQALAEEDHHGGYDHADKHRQLSCPAHPQLDAVDAARPQVLSGKGAHRVAQRGARQFDQAHQTAGCIETRHECIPEAVDHPLQRQSADGDDQVLEGDGCAQLQQAEAHFFVQVQIASVDAHHWRADHRDQAHDAAQALAAHGGDGCALYAPAKAHDKENVQHDVGDGCRHHRQQWSRTVAHRPQEPREQVEGSIFGCNRTQ